MTTPPRRMIVVDDDPKVRMLLERAFRQPEFETHAFPTGKAALASAAEIRPDCVVSDVLMPDMDGESLLRALRGVPGLEAVPFIALSAVRSEARIRAILSAGADAFLLKPFPLRELTEKVRTLVGRPLAARSTPGLVADDMQPTRPVVPVPHTTSTAAVRRPPAPAPPEDELELPQTLPFPSEPELSVADAQQPEPPSQPPAASPPVPAPPPAPAVVVSAAGPVRVLTPLRPPSETAPRTMPLAPVRVATKGPAPGPDVRRVELGPPDTGLGFGRFTRVEVRGRSFVVLTETVAEPKFTVTTVITEKEVPLRKVETALPHPLAREEDRETVRHQLDLQHDEVLRRLDDFVLDGARRRVVWSDQNRSVDAGLLAWALSSVAQLAEAEVGTEETARQLHLTRERALVGEDVLRSFQITSSARVVVDPRRASQFPRRTVRAVAMWCHDFATTALLVDADTVAEPVRQATRRHAAELERMGFYERLQRRSRA
jgi:CheY-like chemotaxis protein